MTAHEHHIKPPAVDMQPSIGTIAVAETASIDLRHEALQTLIALGVFRPLRGLDTFHGRVAKRDDPKWTVNPEYGSELANPSSSNNAHDRSLLYTGNTEDAREFGQYRAGFVVEDMAIEMLEAQLLQKNPFGEQELNARQQYHRLSEEERNTLWAKAAKQFKIEIHQIDAHDPDALIIDYDFDPSKLDAEQTKSLNSAVTLLATEPFETHMQSLSADPERRQEIIDALNKAKVEVGSDKPGYNTAVIINAIEESGKPRRSCIDIAAALNAKQILDKSVHRAVNLYLDSNDDLSFEMYDTGEGKLVPISNTLVRSFLDSINVIGIKHRPRSTSLGKSIDTVSFFNLHAIHAKDS